MKRIAFHLLAGASSLLFVVVAAILVRSYIVADVWESADSKTSVIVVIGRGEVLCRRTIETDPTSRIMPQPLRRLKFRPALSARSLGLSGLTTHWSSLGSRYTAGAFGPFGKSGAMIAWGQDLLLPLWPLLLLLLLLPIAWWRVALRDANRRRAGCCRQCGYDLRASAGRCPECGWQARALTPVPAPSSR